jgi:hypothetical protein
VLEHGTDDLGLLFSGGDVLLRMAGWRILESFIRFGTLLVALVPGGALAAYGYFAGQNLELMASGAAIAALFALPVYVYVDAGLRLGDLAVTLENLGPTDALDRSWELARGNRVTLWTFFLVMDLVSVAGLLFCFVGAIATSAAAETGTTEAFLLATRGGVDQWAIPREKGL